MSENSSKFTNRRGHSLEPTQTELNSLQIDSQPPVEDSTPAVQPKVKPYSKSQRRPRITRRAGLIAAALLLVLLAAAIGLGEYVTARYQSADGTAARVQKIASELVVPQQTQPDITANDLAAPLTALGEVRDDLCPGGYWDNAAQLYPRAREAAARCNDTKQQVAQLIAKTSTVQAQLAYLEQLQRVLKPIHNSQEGQFAVLSAQLANWKQSTEGLKKLSPPASFADAHDELTGSAIDIYAAWAELNDGFKRHDAQQFNQAQDKLNKGYKSFQSISLSLRQAINQTQTKLTGSYQAVLAQR